MAKDFIAIDTLKNIYEFSQFGINSLKERHRLQRVQGWQYGLKSEKNELLKKVITVQDAQSAIAENAELKKRLAELEAMKDKRGAKAQTTSDNTEK